MVVKIKRQAQRKIGAYRTNE